MIKKLTIYIFALISAISAFSQNSKKIPSEKPKLIVGIVVDQMRYDYLNRYWDKFEKNGFKRLIAEGASCKNANLDYIFTHTAVGHATIFTGAQPSYHGIVSNSWYNRLKEKSVYSVEDDKTKTIGSKSDAGKKSPKNLLTTTIGDEIKLSFNKSKVVGISLKDRSAILSAGHSANSAWWFDKESGNWITSSYYIDSVPNWVSDFNKKKYPDLYLERQWTTILPLNEYTESLPDNNPYEIGIGVKNITFPYDLTTIRGANKNYDLLLNTPFGNTLTKDFAIAAIVNENLGKDDSPDFISISFSATDYIGHLYGPNSIEIQDTYLRLDKEIAHFLEFIDSNIGKENTLIFLTSDHGVSTIPNYLKSKKIPSGYFNYNYAITLLKSYLNALYGYGDWVKTYSSQQIYLNRNLIEDSKLNLEDVQTKVAQFFSQFTGVANTITSSALQKGTFVEGINQKFQNSYNQNRSGDVLINLEPGWIEEGYDATTHNSAYSYDTHVPLIWYGWKINRKSISRRVSITEIAPTISTFLNISYPSGCMTQPIIELTD